MSVVINTNFAATLAANNLAASTGALQRSLNRLSSGSKIVSPADDAGGLAVSMKLSATVRRQKAIERNLGNTVSFLQTQDGVLKVGGKVLDRISELKVLCSDPTKSETDKANYDTEYQALKTALTSLGQEKFNGISLFGTNSLSVATTEDGNSAVTVQGVNLTGAATPAFAPFTDNFANLANWTDTSFNGGSRYLNGSAMDLYGGVFGKGEASSLQSFSGPFHLTMDLQLTGGTHSFTMKMGGTTLFTENAMIHSGSTTVSMDYDGNTLTTSAYGVSTTQTVGRSPAAS